jgi:hypothetical protein
MCPDLTSDAGRASRDMIMRKLDNSFPWHLLRRAEAARAQAKMA